MNDLAGNRVGTFMNYFRLNTVDFNYVLEKVAPLIRKSDAEIRQSISPEIRLMITLQYPATGASMTSLHYDWCVSVSSISNIIPKTCQAIYDSLKQELLSINTTVDEWLEIANTLEENCNFPNAIGNCDLGLILVHIIRAVCKLRV